jgi:hypothetical protein
VSLPHLPHPGNEKGPRQNLLAEPHRQTHPSIATESPQKLPRHSFAAAAVKGHERPPAVHKYSEPFRVQSTVKSVTDPAIVACYRS